MGCGCNEKKYSISMGCCQPVLGPIENYYTKPQIDKMIEEIESAITSGCCITEEEVDEKIESAKTEIEAEIPSLSGYATEQWVLNQHYISGVDLSNYATKSEIPVVPTSNTAFTNDAGYLTEHQPIKTINGQSLIGTGDIEIGTGGTIDLSNYYTTAETQSAITQAVSGKVDTSMFTAYTGAVDTILSGKADISYVDSSVSGKANTSDVITSISDNRMGSNYGINYTKNGVTTAKWIFTASSGLTVDGRNISVDPSIVAYKDDVTTLINQAVSGKQDTLSAGTNITIVDNVISATNGGGPAYSASSGINISNNEISTKVGNGLRYTQDGTLEVNSTNAIATGNTQVPLSYVVYNYVNNNCMMKSQIWCGTQAEYDAITTKDNNVIYLIYD